MTHGGAFDPPDWYGPFTTLQAIAEELRCSVMEAAATDPDWRAMAKAKILAGIESGRRRGAAHGTEVAP